MKQTLKPFLFILLSLLSFTTQAQTWTGNTPQASGWEVLTTLTLLCRLLDRMHLGNAQIYEEIQRCCLLLSARMPPCKKIIMQARYFRA